MSTKFITLLDQLNEYRRTKISNRHFLVLLAVVVGILAGLASALLKALTNRIEYFLQTDFKWEYKYYLYFLFPAIGIFLAVLYVRYFIRKSKFETGLTPLLYAISKKSSKIDVHNSYSQIITSALTVGFGGSVGLESPIVTSGSAIGSFFGRFFGLSYREVTLLLACGAAAGIAGAFNSPIGGMVFAIEILLPEFTIPAFIPLLLSSATAVVVASVFYNEKLFYLVSDGWHFNALVYYVLLAVCIGLYSVFFAKVNYALKDFFYRIKNTYHKVLIGGLFLGLLVFLFPTLYGEGYITIKNLLQGNNTAVISNSIFSHYAGIPLVVILFTLATIFAKSIATLVTLCAGGNGGAFAPSLIIGGLMGFLVAYTVNLLGIAQLSIPNFIVVGMAAALGSIMHAPLTGIFLIAEITGGYEMMVPLMITTALAYLINKSIDKYSIYTKSLGEKGELSYYEDKDTTVLNMMKLRYLVEKDFLLLYENDLLKDRMPDILKSKRNIFPVIDEQQTFKGIIYIEDLLKMTMDATIDDDEAYMHHLLHPAPQIIDVNTDVKQVLLKMETENVWMLPVINQQNTFVGFISKTAIFNKYRAMLKRQADSMS